MDTELTPLAVLLEVMRVQLRAGEYTAAANAARAAAPYLHVRAGSVKAGNSVAGKRANQRCMSDAELEAVIRANDQFGLFGPEEN